MKPSRFLILSDIPGTGTLACSSYTGALAKAGDEFLDVINTLSSGRDVDSDAPVVKEMLRCGFIAEDDTDELALYERLITSQKNRHDILKLVIAPTLECNFRCGYCFEEHKDIYMSLQVQDALINYVRKKISLGGIKTFSVVWYGGEPLLRKDIISRLSEAFIEACMSNRVRYSASIITNGYLVDEETAHMLKHCGITFAQVTIDGTPEIHNARRPLRDSPGEDTYSRIIESINFLGDAGISVSVRINVDSENVSYCERTTAKLAEDIHHRNTTSVSPGHVFSYEENSGRCISKNDYAQVRFDCLKLCIKHNFSITSGSIFPKLRASYCTATMPYVFVIDPEGLVYKCWNDIGIEAYSIGDVDSLTADDLASEFECSGWGNYSQMNYKSCRECKVLPVCAGGCPRKAVHFGGSNECEYYRYILDDLLRLNYFIAKGGGRNGVSA